MSLVSKLSCKESWEEYLTYKTSLAVRGKSQKDLARLVEDQSYIPAVRRISSGEDWPLPRRVVISKMSSQKKRVVYIYPEPENTVLKLLTYLLLRKYDGLFSDGLYSFRPGVTAKDAVRKLRRTSGIASMWSYKVDISNYFNSVPVERFLPVLKAAVADDPELFDFLARLLSEPRVMEWADQPEVLGENGFADEAEDLAEGLANGTDAPELSAALHGSTGGFRIIEEQKGIMAGTPLSAFYANLYLMDMDRHFQEEGVLYARYSDDIIVFAKTEEEVRARAAEIRAMLAEKGLAVNPNKETVASPEGGWTFLGFSHKDGVTDIAPATVLKIKGKMRRKARALVRWREKNGRTGEQAAAAFIRVFNRKLLGISGKPEERSSGGEKAAGAQNVREPMENSLDGPLTERDLTWSLWFFPVISTTKSLQEIDNYAQDCLRYIISGKRTKARFNVRYEDLKALGYRSLVHEYYAFNKAT